MSNAMTEAEQAIRDARITNRDELLKEYRACMQRGTQYQKHATEMYLQAEQAAADYAQMKKDFRASPANRGALPATVDYKFGRYDVAQAAVKDNTWYMTRAMMSSAAASMEFNKAAALMQNIVRIEAKL